MKSLLTKTLFTGILTTSTLFFGCQKATDAPEKLKLETSSVCSSDDISDVKTNMQMGTAASTSATSPYSVHLAQRFSNHDGTWTWVWFVKNPKPGNGIDNGTVQDLSHWNISLGDCVKLSNIVSAATSTDNANWNPVELGYEVDKSQDCYTQSIFKFDYGTSSEDNQNGRYYRLVVNVNVPMKQVTTVYKSGRNTGCGIIKTCGFGCVPQ